MKGLYQDIYQYGPRTGNACAGIPFLVIPVEHLVLQSKKLLEVSETILVRLSLRQEKSFFGMLPNSSKKRIVLHVVVILITHKTLSASLKRNCL